MSEGPRSPLEALGALASQEVEVTGALRHVELYTLGGLLTLLWHGDPELEHVVIACGGAMGGLLGPAEGLVAVRAAIVLGDDVAGVVTLATQTSGCEEAERLGTTPVILFHGENDELLPPQASELVQMLTGGELVVFPGTGHLLTEVGEELRERLGQWIPARFA